METPDQDINSQDQKQETLSDTRVHPDHVFDAVKLFNEQGFQKAFVIDEVHEVIEK